MLCRYGYQYDESYQYDRYDPGQPEPPLEEHKRKVKRKEKKEKRKHRHRRHEEPVEGGGYEGGGYDEPVANQYLPDKPESMATTGYTMPGAGR